MADLSHSERVGYFITMGFYGHWLPGRAAKAGEIGEPKLQEWVKQQMTQSAVLLETKEEREIVLHECVKTAAILHVKLGAVHVRTNHMHLVCGLEIEANHLMQSVKRSAGMRLRQHWNMPGVKVWAAGANCRTIFGERGWNAAIDYVVEQQGEKMAVWAKGARA